MDLILAWEFVVARDAATNQAAEGVNFPRSVRARRTKVSLFITSAYTMYTGKQWSMLNLSQAFATFEPCGQHLSSKFFVDLSLPKSKPIIYSHFSFDASIYYLPFLN